MMLLFCHFRFPSAARNKVAYFFTWFGTLTAPHLAHENVTAVFGEETRGKVYPNPGLIELAGNNPMSLK